MVRTFTSIAELSIHFDFKSYGKIMEMHAFLQSFQLILSQTIQTNKQTICARVIPAVILMLIQHC